MKSSTRFLIAWILIVVIIVAGIIVSVTERNSMQAPALQELSGSAFLRQIRNRPAALFTGIPAVIPETVSGLAQAFSGIFR